MSILLAMGESLRAIYEPSATLPREWRQLLREIGSPDGDPEERAFGAELARLRPRLRSYAHSLTRGMEAAEDLVQETFLRAWSARARFEPGTSMRAWTFAILRNLFLSQRRRARFVGDFDEADAERRLAQGAAQVASAEVGQILGLIDRLPEEQREALRLVALDGLSYDEGAARAGTTIGAFKSRVSRARTALRDTMDGPLDRSFRAVRSERAQSIAEPPASRTHRLRDAWAEAKAAGRPLIIG